MIGHLCFLDAASRPSSSAAETPLVAPLEHMAERAKSSVGFVQPDAESFSKLKFRNF